jgi:lysophospholipase L1-like esterase
MNRKLLVSLVSVLGLSGCSNNVGSDLGAAGVSVSAAGRGAPLTVPAGSAGNGTSVGALTGAGTGSTPTVGAAGVGVTAAAGIGGGVAGVSGTAPSTAGTASAPTMTAGTGAAGSVSAAAGTGSGGAGGAAAGGAGTGASTFKRPCVSAGKEVVFIGDSYSVYAVAHTDLAVLMEKQATTDGALKAGDHYRNLAAAGTTLAAAPAGIQSQWEGTKAMTPIKAVVMDGGGNDVLISNPGCRPEGSEKMANCQMVVQASLDAAKKLFGEMKTAGATDVLYFWYPHIPGGILTGGEKAISISDWTYPMLQAVAAAASTDTFHVWVVPTVSIFESHPEYFYSDGLHANDMGETKIADAIWKVMKDNCIGQGSSSGCCMP